MRLGDHLGKTRKGQRLANNLNTKSPVYPSRENVIFVRHGSS